MRDVDEMLRSLAFAGSVRSVRLISCVPYSLVSVRTEKKDIIRFLKTCTELLSSLLSSE